MSFASSVGVTLKSNYQTVTNGPVLSTDGNSSKSSIHFFSSLGCPISICDKEVFEDGCAVRSCFGKSL